jgi:hypothetical protein
MPPPIAGNEITPPALATPGLIVAIGRIGAVGIVRMDAPAGFEGGGCIGRGAAGRRMTPGTPGRGGKIRCPAGVPMGR